MNTEQKKKDYSICCARCVAMVFIILCHIMQRDSLSTPLGVGRIEWAFWFNVGVQMFLFISGLLYGKRCSISALDFYKRNLLKLLVDYYVFVIVMIILIKCTNRIEIHSAEIIGLLTMTKTTFGLGHLWYVPTMLFCYLITPPLLSALNMIKRKMRWWLEMLAAIALLVLVHCIVFVFLKMFNPAWINCYALGMIYGKLDDKKTGAFVTLIVLLTAVIIPLQLRIDYWPHDPLPNWLKSHYHMICNYGHVFLGITLVVSVRAIYNL